MSTITSIFEWLVTMAGTSLVILAIGTLLTWSWGRPIERLRSIQATLAALLVACALQQLHVLPQFSLGWLSSRPSLTESQAANARFPVNDGRQNAAPQQPATTNQETGFVNIDGRPADISSNPLGNETIQPTESAAHISTSKSAFTPFDIFRVTSVLAFFGGVAWSLFSIAAAFISLRKLHRQCDRAPADIIALLHEMVGARKHVAVLCSPTIRVPATFGIWWPVVLLPQSMIDSASRAVLRDCMAHEWSHICRRDIALWWSVQALQPLFWYQPLYWALRRELRLCQDQVADHFAAGKSPDAFSYAELLVNLAKTRHSCQSNLALTINDGQSNLARRIQLLVSSHQHLAAACRSWTVAIAAIVLIIVSGALGTINLGQAEEQGNPSATEKMESNAKGSSGAPEAEINKADTKSADAKSMPAASTVSQSLQQIGTVANSQTPDPAVMGEELPDGSLKYAGIVFDKTTKLPIKGAVVTVHRLISASYERRTLEETKHTTDEAGKYTFVIPPDQLKEKLLYIELDVEHPDFATRAGFGYALSMIRKNAKLGDPPFFASLEMDPAEAVTGRLVGPDGKAIVDVAIQAFSMNDSHNFDSVSWFNTKSDGEGKFRISLVKGGRSVFWIVPDKLAPKQIVSGTKRGDFGDVQLEEGVESNGQVVGATGKPLAGVYVNLTDRKSQAEIQIPVASQLSRAGLSDAEGRFEIGALKPGTYEVEVENYPRDIRLRSRERKSSQIPAVFPRRTITINPGQQDPLLVRAVPHVKFEGQYLDSKGNKKGGWEQHVFGKLDGEFYFGQLRANAEGTIHGMLPLGLEDVQLDLISNEHGALRVRLGKDKPLIHGRRIPLATIEGDITDVEIIKYTAPIVQIKIVDEEGKQVESAKLAAIYEGDDEDKLVSPVGGKPTSIFFENQPGGIRRTSQLLPDEKTKFIASADGYDDAQETLTLPEGETRELTLVLKKSTAAIEVKPESAEKMEKPAK